jgi:hypothetical protein
MLYSIRSGMVHMPMPCRSLMFSSTGIFAMEPSSSMMAQMTPAGARPARRARSTDPSVWPVLTITPPGRAISGNTWPGRTRSWGFALSATAVRMVVARSAAETRQRHRGARRSTQ